MGESKIKSRKFWMTLIGLFTVVATEFCGVPSQVAHTVARAIEMLVPIYVGSQGLVDSARHVARIVHKPS